MQLWRVGAFAVAVLVGTACSPHPVGPARSYEGFARKAKTSAEAALTAVETVRLAAENASDGRAFGPYTAVTVSEQEDSLSGVQGTFDSIQPPGDRADELRDELDELLSNALDHVADVRVAARRGQLKSLADVAQPLTDDAAALDQFIAEQS